MTFKVTHVDHHGRRRQLVLQDRNRNAAERHACQALGAARYLAVMVLRGRGI